jgi:hypothetical protein
MINSNLQKDKDVFISWLQEEKKLEYKSSKDCYYRCARVEKISKKSIELLLTSEEGFLELIRLIHQYSVQNNMEKKTAYALTGTLRAAIKKYGEFKNPNSASIYKKRHFCKYL